MALSATFKADFSSFYDAVDKAEVKLKEMSVASDAVGKRLTNMATSFSGQKVISEASLMVKAIGGVEGITKLTEKEIARLGATTNEAVEKLKLLGKDVPKNLQQVADATKGANKASIDWMGSLTKIAGAVGIAFSVDAIVGFVGSVFEAASAVKDLSQQWGVSTKAVQQWSAAAKASGVEAKTVGNTLQHMTTQMAEGSDLYRASLENIGLSYEKLQKLPLEEQYRQVITAISGVTDETQRLEIAIGILGPKAKQMIGAIEDGFLDAAGAQAFMTDETIERLAAAEDAWGRFKDKVIIYTGEMVAGAMERSEVLFSSWSNFFTIAGKTFKDMFSFSGTSSAQEWIKQQEQAAAAAKGVADALVPVASHGEAVNKVYKTQAQLAKELKDKQDALNKSQQARAKALEEAKRAEEAMTRELKKHDDALDALVNSFGGASGQGAIGKANDYMAALRQAIPIEQMSVKAKADIHKVMEEAIASYQAMGQMAPKVMYDIWLATKKASEGVIEFSSRWLNFAHLVNTTPIDLGPGFALSLPPPKPGIFDGFAEGAVAAMAESMLKAIQGGGNVFAAASTTLVNYMFDPKQSGFGKALEAQIAKLPSALGGLISGALPLVGAFIAPAVQKLSDKILGWFGEAEHQKLRRSMIQAAGGVKELTKAANDAGVSLDKLMRARNTSAVEAEMRKIQAAIEFQATALDQVIETAERYGITLEELGPAMQRSQLDKQAQQLFKDWEVLNAAGLETIVITEKMGEEVSAYIQQAAKMGIEVPSAMRPMLEAMIEAGTLTDENGVAFEDLEDAGVNFSMTMTEGFLKMIEAVEKLTEAIGRGLTQAIDNVPAVTIPVQYGGLAGVLPPHLQNAAPSFAHGSGGFRDFGTGTPAILHGVEAVVPRGQALGGPIQITVISQLDGREVARNQVKYIPRELGLAGV